MRSGCARAENHTAGIAAGGVVITSTIVVQGTVQLSVLATEDPEGMVGTVAPTPCNAACPAHSYYAIRIRAHRMSKRT